MQALLRAVGRPLAAPSANASGSISPTRAEHVLKSLGGRIPLIIDGGADRTGLESTIVAATGGELRLLRPGPDRRSMRRSHPAAKIEAPGQLASHYAPSKPLRLNATTPIADEYLIGFGPVAGDATLSSFGRPGRSRSAAVRPASPGRCIATSAHRRRADPERRPRRGDQRSPAPRRGLSGRARALRSAPGSSS